MGLSFPLSNEASGTIRGSSRSPNTSNRIGGCLRRSNSWPAGIEGAFSPAFALLHPVATVTVTHIAAATAERAAVCANTARRLVPALPYPVVTRRVGSMDASLRSVQRLLGQWAPQLRGTDRGGPTLETLPAVTESPRLAPATVTENDTFCARAVPTVQAEAFRGFLDGAQTSRVVMYDRGVPIIHGVAAAVIRERRDRRLVTWRGVRKHEAVYAPMTLVPDVCQRLSDDGVEVVDTSARLAESDPGIPADGAHPAVLVDRARRCVE